VDFQVRISNAALADFAEILNYSWVNFPSAAERFGNARPNHVELLKRFPYVGSPVEGRVGVRQLVHTPILVYYRVDEDRKLVEILHFWHGSRDSATGLAVEWSL
jgi:plasmid stabilization system protein ParE